MNGLKLVCDLIIFGENMFLWIFLNQSSSQNLSMPPRLLNWNVAIPITFSDDVDVIGDVVFIGDVDIIADVAEKKSSWSPLELVLVLLSLLMFELMWLGWFVLSESALTLVFLQSLLLLLSMEPRILVTPGILGKRYDWTLVSAVVDVVEPRRCSSSHNSLRGIYSTPLHFLLNTSRRIQ